MNIVIAGQDVFAARAYSTLRAMDGITISAAFVDPPGDYAEWVEHDGIPAAPLATVRHITVAAPFIREAKADVLVLANVPFLIPKPVIDAPSWGTLCYHPSLLPRHRGRDAVKWTLAMGDTETGVTIFRADGGMDTGPIVWQRSCPIPKGVSPGGLYYRTLVPLGIDALVHSVAAVRDGQVWLREQDETRATYEPPMVLETAAD